MTSKLLITTDLGHLKVYRLDENENWSRPRVRLLEAETTSVTEHLSSVLADQPGQFQENASRAGPHDRSDGELHNISLERRRRALKYAAQHINELISRQKRRSWYLAADRKINRSLVEALDKTASSRLEKNVHHNLVNLGTEEVLSHFFGRRARGLELDVVRGTRRIKHQPRIGLIKNSETSGKLLPEAAAGLTSQGSRMRSSSGVRMLNRSNGPRKPSTNRKGHARIARER
jgi:hypothetical protein